MEQKYACRKSIFLIPISLFSKNPCVSSESLTIVFLPRVWEDGPKHCWWQGFLHLVCPIWDSTVWILARWDWRPTWNHLWEGYCKGGKGFQGKFTDSFLLMLYSLLLILLLLPFGTSYMLDNTKHLRV